MLVQKRRTQNKTIFLWGGIAILVGIALLLVYQNISTESVNVDPVTITTVKRLTVPTDFGEELFSDPRFNEVSSDKQISEFVSPYVTTFDIVAQSMYTVATPEQIEVINPGFGGRLHITWSPVEHDNLTGYVLSRSQQGSTFTEIAYIEKDETSYNDSMVVNGQAYSYRVFAFSGIEATETTQVDVERNSNSGNSLSFAFPDTVEGVQIFRTQNGEESLLVTLKNQTTQYLDSTGDADAQYRAVLYAKYIESKESPIATGIPADSIAPDPPSDIKVVSAEDGAAIYIYWTNPLDPDFDYVRIYRSTTQGALERRVKDARTSYIANNNTCNVPDDANMESFPFDIAEGDCFVDDINIEDGNTYYYVLTSVDQVGNESSKRIIRAFGKDNPFSY